MEKETQELLEEIVRNARSDRKTVEKVRDNLVKLADDPATMVEGMSMVLVAENVAKLSDALTKMNTQLVELVKIRSKDAPPPEDPQKTDADDIYSELEKPEDASEAEPVN